MNYKGGAMQLLTDILDLVYLLFASNVQKVNLHVCTDLTAVYWMLKPLGEAAAKCSLQLSSQTHFRTRKDMDCHGNELG